jgi:hypothetical protein
MKESAMAQRDELAAEGSPTSTECLLAYRDSDGSIRSVGPLSQDRAEALVQVWGRMYPNQTCWVEPLAKEIRALHTGRVQRHRRLPLVTASDNNH